jgi:hypothetical protein
MTREHRTIEPSQTRMAQQRDVYRKAKTIFIPPPGSDQTMIVPAQSVKTHQLLWVFRKAEQFLSGFCGKQGLSCHLCVFKM